jgi:transposase
MGNVLKTEKQEQVRALGRLKWSLRRIQDETGVHRDTVKRYLKAAGIPIREPRKRQLDADAQPKPASEVTADPGSKPASEVTADREPPPRASLCEPHRDSIKDAVDRGRPAIGIWQDLVTELGFSGSYESVKRFVRKLQPSAGKVAHPRIETEPGVEAQVDYGDGPMVRHPETGKYRRARLFAMTLGFSRKAVFLLTWKSSSQIWCELHEEAFRRLGGTPKTVVLDNLKEGVLAPDFYDPTLNPLYRDMLAHYGVVALPARVRHPNRKGKVESSVGYAQKTPLRGQRFESLEEAQRYLDQWTDRWADTRIHGTTKQQVAAMFAEEKPSLQILPVESFRYYQHGTRAVHVDGTVEVNRAYYAAPAAWIGRDIHVRWDGRFVRILDPKTGALLREYLRERAGRYRVDPRDRSPKTPKSIEQLLNRARHAGKHIGVLCQVIEQRRAQFGGREILGVLSLVKKHGWQLVDECCATALEVGAPRYRTVRKLVERRPHAPPLRQVDDLIRDLAHYRQIIDTRS